MKKSSLILVKTFQGADRTPDQPPTYILHLTVTILFTITLLPSSPERSYAASIP